MQFERPHHQNIARILVALDAAFLRSCGCYFGGGTAITLAYGEYRESVDIDLIVSDSDGYRRLRETVRSDKGLAGLMTESSDHLEYSDVRTDQYGIRTRFFTRTGEPIKFEIVHEGRVVLDTPISSENICGVATLSRNDMATTKLLANSDRWADKGVHSRDLIDLVMLELNRKELAKSIAKAEVAYGTSIRKDLAKAIDYLIETEGWIERCTTSMKIVIPKAVLWQKLLKLKRLSEQV